MKRKLASIKQITWDKSKELRRELTVAERLLWRKLQRKQLGAPFRKQHPIDPYIVDFCCVQNNLIIEIDGDTHLQGTDRDTTTSGRIIWKVWDGGLCGTRIWM